MAEKLATKRDLKELELRLLGRLGSMMVGTVIVVVALVKLLKKTKRAFFFFSKSIYRVYLQRDGPSFLISSKRK